MTQIIKIDRKTVIRNPNAGSTRTLVQCGCYSTTLTFRYIPRDPSLARRTCPSCQSEKGPARRFSLCV